MPSCLREVIEIDLTSLAGADMHALFSGLVGSVSGIYSGI